MVDHGSGDASGFDKGFKMLNIADDGSPVMGKEPPFVIKNIHVYDSKSADKNLERKANPTAKELKNESIISSKQYHLPQNGGAITDKPQKDTVVPIYDGDPDRHTRISLRIANRKSGFVEALEKRSPLVITAPPTGKADFSFKWMRGILVISNVSALTRKETVAPPTVNVWTYKGFDKKKPATKSDADTLDASVEAQVEVAMSSELYVFCGSGPKVTSLNNCFIRFKDLEQRINGDIEILDTPSFPVWGADGKLIIKSNFMTEYEQETITGRYRLMGRLLQGAQTRRLAPYDVLARFWDAKVELSKPITFYMVFLLDVHTTLKEKLPVGKSPFEKIKATIEKTLESSKLSYKPQTEYLKVHFANDFETSIVSDKKTFFQVGRHPNDLYRMYASHDDFHRLITAAKGRLYRPPLEYIFDSSERMQKEFAEQVAKIKTLFVKRRKDKDIIVVEKGRELTVLKKESRGTVTYVNKNRIETAAGKKRHLDQKTVMGGNSANDLMNALFKRDKDEPVRRAEWLHRSARAYGGLDRQPLETTQTPENLILGTVQTNTMMLRQELFVKRYVCNVKDQTNGEGATIQVNTRLLHATGKLDRFNSKTRSLWFGAFLWYHYHVVNENEIPCKQNEIFKPFARRNPMRLELYLDIAMERLIYGWGDADVPDKNDDDSSDDEGDDAMEEEPDMMFDSVQIDIGLEDIWEENIWEDDQLEDNKLLLDEAESLVAAEEALLDSH